MNISKEVRIGLLVATATVTFFAGFYFLKGSDVFSNEKEYYCYYTNVDGLQGSSMVQVMGFNVGHVVKMELEGSKGIKVTIAVKNSTEIPKGTIASLASPDLLGGKVVRLILGPGPGTEPAGATLETKKDDGAIDKISGELTPRLEELKTTISTLNNALANINSLLGEDNQKTINSTIQSLKVTADNMAQITNVLSRESEQMSGIIRNTNSITGNLAKSNDTITKMLSNFNRISGQLANAPIQKTITELEKTSKELQSILDKINNNKGSLGMLVNDKEAYNNLNKSLKSITNLTDDLKAHPGRYINISVFGGKKK